MDFNTTALSASAVQSHYETEWNRPADACRSWTQGPSAQLPPGFVVLEFAPTPTRQMWTYATCGMSCQGDAEPIELHLFSPKQSDTHVELLTVVAHFHLTGAYLGLWHTVNFGRPWMPGSLCSHGLISLPYLDGPSLEWCEFSNRTVRFLWLIPITSEESAYKQKEGVEALEEAFERASFDYLNPFRDSVVTI